MYEYKVIEAKNTAEAEKVMNIMASEGWRVISNVFWSNFKAVFIITFEREKEN